MSQPSFFFFIESRSGEVPVLFIRGEGGVRLRWNGCPLIEELECCPAPKGHQIFVQPDGEASMHRVDKDLQLQLRKSHGTIIVKVQKESGEILNRWDVYFKHSPKDDDRSNTDPPRTEIAQQDVGPPAAQPKNLHLGELETLFRKILTQERIQTVNAIEQVLDRREQVQQHQYVPMENSRHTLERRPSRERDWGSALEDGLGDALERMITEVEAGDSGADQASAEPQLLQELRALLRVLDDTLSYPAPEAERSAIGLVRDLCQRLDTHDQPPLARARKAQKDREYRTVIESITDHLKFRREGQQLLTVRNLEALLAGIVRELWKGDEEGGFQRAQGPLERCLEVLGVSLYIPEHGSSWNPKKQRVVSRQQVAKGQGLNQVLRVVEPGLCRAQEVLEKAQVEISEGG